MKKVAVLFPGIGYNNTKPLMYYSKKLVLELGYEVITVDYSGFDTDIRGNSEKMNAAFLHGMEQTEMLLSDICWDNYSEILFISKSIGTVISTQYAIKHGLQTNNIFYTPLELTFVDGISSGMVFTGTKDPWVKHDEIVKLSSSYKLHLSVYENANHSLETENVVDNVSILLDVISKVKKYLS